MQEVTLRASTSERIQSLGCCVIFPPGAAAISIRLKSLAYFSASGLCLRRFLPVIDSANRRGKHLPWLGCALTSEHVAADTSAQLLSGFNQVLFFFPPHTQLTFPTQDSPRVSFLDLGCSLREPQSECSSPRFVPSSVSNLPNSSFPTFSHKLLQEN